jgi:hypothetical protein
MSVYMTSHSEMWQNVKPLVNNQRDAQFFSMYLFQLSTCFEQPRAHHQENQLYQYLVGPSHETVTEIVTYTRCCIDTIDSPDDEHGFARNM